MKKNSIRKKVYLYIVFFLSFLLSITFVNADEGLADGASERILGDYYEAYCDIVTNSDYYTLTRDDAQGFKGYIVTAGNSAPNGAKATVSCRGRKTGSSGIKIFTKTYERFPDNSTEEISQTGRLVLNKFISVQFHETNHYILNEAGLTPGQVNDLVFNGASGNGWIASLSGSEIVVAVDPNAHYANSIETGTFSFSFKDENGNLINATVNLTIDFTANIRAYTSNYGTCDMSGWDYVSGSGYNPSYRKATDNSGNITLPSCTPNTDKATFMGWIKGESRTLAANECKNGSFVTGASGGTITPLAGEYNYYACYEYKNYTYLQGSKRGSVSDSNWVHFNYSLGVDGEVANSGYYKPSNVNADNVTLPNFTVNSSDFEFGGWRKYGVTYEPGTVVPNDGSIYSPIIKIVSGGFVNREYMFILSIDEVKTFSLNDKKILSPTHVSGPSDAVSIECNNGKCDAKGVNSSATQDNPAVYTFRVEGSDEEYTVKYIVKKNTAYGTGSFVLDLSTGDWYDGSSSGPGGGSRPGLGSGLGEPTNGDGCSYKLVDKQWPAGDHTVTNSAIYYLEANCGGETIPKFGTLCLDPGLLGPNIGDEYELERQLDDYSKWLDRVSKSIFDTWGTVENAKSIMDTLTSSKRIMANVAVRTASFRDEGCSGSTAPGSGLQSHTDFYVEVCNDYVTHGQISDTHSPDWYTGTDLEDANVHLRYAVNYSAVSPEEKKIEYSLESLDATDSKFVSKVKVVLPTGITLNSSSLQAFCPSGASICTASYDQATTTITMTYKGDVYPTKETWYVMVKPEGDLPYNKVKLLKPVGGSKQRLIVLGNVDSKIKIPGIDTDLVCPSTWSEIASSEDPNLYLPACCAVASESDRTSDLFQTACNSNCVKSSYVPACKLDTPAFGRDILELKEAADYQTGADKYGSCVVFTESGRNGSISADSARNYTQNLTDYVGNNINVDKFLDNKYCRYTCSEEWKWAFETYGSFTGAHAKFAGSFFEVDKEVYLNGKSKCVSTYVDYDKYMDDQQILTDALTATYNQYSEVALLMYNLDYGAGSENENRSNEDNHYYTKTTCYNYGNPNSYTSVKKCGTKTGVASDYATCNGHMDSNTDESFYCSRSEVTRKTPVAPATKGDCPTGAYDDGTSCWNYTKYEANKCWAPSDSGYSDSNFSFDCWDYTVAASKSNANNKYELFKNDYIMRSTGSYNIIDKEGRTNVDKSDMAPNEDILENWGLEGGSSLSTNAAGFIVQDSDPADSNSNCDTLNNNHPLCDLDSDHGGTATNPSTNDSFAAEQYKDLIDNKVSYTPRSTGDGYKFGGDYSSIGSGKLFKLMSKAQKQMRKIQQDIKSNATEFDQCQNTGIANEEGSHKFDYTQYKYNSGFAVKVPNPSYYNPAKTESKGEKINVNYDPKIAYNYDEQIYIDEIKKNDTTYLYENVGGYGHKKDDGTRYWPNYEDKLNSKNEIIETEEHSDGLDIKINVITEKYYKDDLGWGSSSTNGLTYSSSNVTSRSTKTTNLNICGAKVQDDSANKNGKDKSNAALGDCGIAQFAYYEVNYNYYSLENAAYYSNDGVWLVNELSDKKVHVSTASTDKNKVLNKDNEYYTDTFKGLMASQEGNASDWSTLGYNHNVFPIRFDTPRNMYQYAYSFSDIGVYGNSTELGRIQGHSNSVLEYNTYSCFYEVVEDFCECCGAPINTTVSEITNIDTQSYVTGYNYSASSGSEAWTKQVGDLGFYTSSVSLYDLDGSKPGLEGNWGSGMSIYYLTEKVGDTDRGQILRDSIERDEVGDHIYDEDNDYIEYTYTLKPGDISKLRNTNFTYGIISDEVEAVGTYNYKKPADIFSNDGNGDPNTNGTDIGAPRFSHYKSLFLENELNDMVTSGYEHDVYTKRSDICAIDSSTTDIHGYIRSNTNCRWIDWLENESSGQYRLAFK